MSWAVSKLASAECVLCAFGQVLELALEVVAVPGWGVQGSRVVTCAGGTMPCHMGWILVWRVGRKCGRLWDIPSTLVWCLRQSNCVPGCDRWFGKRLLETRLVS